MLYFLIILIFGLVAGFLSGLLGVGGGIIIIPVFLYLVPLLGFDALPMSQITGISAAQVITGSFFAFLAHRKYGLMDRKLFFTIGIWAGFGALLGAVISKYVSDRFLLIIYFATLTFAIVTLLTERKQDEEITHIKTNSLLNKASSITAGMISGALGVGGAVLYIPILNFLCHIPLKTTISNVTYLVFITAAATFLGKSATNQVPFDLVIFIVTGAFLGARLGAKASHNMKSSTLKYILLSIMAVTAIRVFISIIS